MNKTPATLPTAAAQLLMIAALTLGVLVAGFLAGNSLPSSSVPWRSSACSSLMCFGEAREHETCLLFCMG